MENVEYNVVVSIVAAFGSFHQAFEFFIFKAHGVFKVFQYHFYLLGFKLLILERFVGLTMDRICIISMGLSELVPLMFNLDHYFIIWWRVSTVIYFRTHCEIIMDQMHT